MFTGLITDLNALEAWILDQKDLWIHEGLTFHKSHLFHRLLASMDKPPAKDDWLARDQIMRCIALAELGARHKMLGWPNKGNT